MASELHLGDSNWKLFQVGYPVDMHTRLGRRDIGTAVKNSLEIIIKQVHLEDCFKRGGRIRVDECLRQIVPNTCASIRKRSFTQCFSVYTRGDKGSCVGCELVTQRRNGYRVYTRGDKGSCVGCELVTRRRNGYRVYTRGDKGSCVGCELITRRRTDTVFTRGATKGRVLDVSW